MKKHNLIDELLAEHQRLESKNYHGEAAALLVNFFGTEDEKDVIGGINASHENRGRLTDSEYDKRNKLSRKYFRILRLLTEKSNQD